jgi:hypothetical protein
MKIVRYIKRQIASMIGARLADVHTHIPAQVVSFDPDTCTASIQPCIKIFRTDDIETGESDLPQLDDIPVCFAGSGNVFLTCPVAVGSYGIYHVAEEDINQWLSQGGIVSPTSVDRFNLDTGTFEPVAPWMFDESFGAIATDRISIRTRDGNTEVSVLENGDVEINASGDIRLNGDSDAVSMASKVDAQIADIDTVLRTWTPVLNDGGTALQTAYKLLVPVAPTSTASSKVKIES